MGFIQWDLFKKSNFKKTKKKLGESCFWLCEITQQQPDSIFGVGSLKDIRSISLLIYQGLNSYNLLVDCNAQFQDNVAGSFPI